MKLAAVLFVASGGLLAIDVSGGVVSMVQARVAGVGSTFRAGSIARTLKVWPPSASEGYDWPDAQLL